MTQRDIAKDKDKPEVTLRDLKRSHDLWRRDALKLEAENKLLRARITELESAALLHASRNVRKPQTHAQMMSDALDKLAQYEREGKR